jgi:hypothetical protein
MSVTRDLEELLIAKRDVRDRYANVLRLKRLIDQMKEKGILTTRAPKVPTIQEIERYGYEMFFGKQPS